MPNFSREKSKIHVENEIITYNGEDMLTAIKEINYILCSLHDMGSFYLSKERRDYETETTQFIDNSLICDRLAAIRTFLVSGFDLKEGEDDMDDVERTCQEIPYWTKPGDQCQEIWIKEVIEKTLREK